MVTKGHGGKQHIPPAKMVTKDHGGKQHIPPGNKTTTVFKSAKLQLDKSGSGEKKRPHHVNLFIALWRDLSRLHTNREHFALTWMWREPLALQLFVNTIIGIDCKPSRCLLKMGYKKCRADYFSTFPACVWGKIDEAFLDRRNPSILPSSLTHHMKALAALDCPSLLHLCNQRQETLDNGRSYSQQSFEVKPLPASQLVAMIGYFLGDWDDDSLEQAGIQGYVLEDGLYDNTELPSLKHMPTYCHLYCTKSHNFTYFLAKDEDGQTQIVAIHIFHTYLSATAREYIRKLLVELFEGHPIIHRSSCLAYDSHMVGFGPFSKRYEKHGGMKVSFYTAVQKLKDKFKDSSLSEQFQCIVDRYAHCHLTNVILALFLELCPSVLPGFFNFSAPFLETADYAPCDLETNLEDSRPSAYQMYITKDYCSEIHQDTDATDFTLCYASHPDGDSTSNIHFVLAKYGVTLDVGDSDIFAFRSSDAHGTAFRPHTHNASYVGCVAANSRLQQLWKRRAKARLSCT